MLSGLRRHCTAGELPVAVGQPREAARPLPAQGSGNLYRTRDPGLAGRRATVALTMTWAQSDVLLNSLFLLALTIVYYATDPTESCS